MTETLAPDLRETLAPMTFDELLEYALELADKNDSQAAQIVRYQARDVEIVKQNDALRGEARAAEKQQALVVEENGRLRDDLHRLTVENARLEGYRDRVLEFDPVTERQVYGDDRQAEFRFREHFGTPAQNIRERRASAFPAGGVMADTYGERPKSWWRRG